MKPGFRTREGRKKVHTGVLSLTSLIRVETAGRGTGTLWEFIQLTSDDRQTPSQRVSDAQAQRRGAGRWTLLRTHRAVFVYAKLVAQRPEHKIIQLLLRLSGVAHLQYVVSPPAPPCASKTVFPGRTT